MITKEQFIGMYRHELHCVRHVAGKVTVDMLEYRPTEKQRSVLELLQYLSMASFAMAEATILGVDMEKYGAHVEASKEVALESFAASMHAQEEKLVALLETLTPEMLSEEVDFFGVRTRGHHLVYQLQMLTAYKMQLFLYVKSCGVTGIGTMDLWVGTDTPVQVD